MISSPKRDITILGLSFALIFFGYAGVQQYVTSYFSERGFYHLGLISLILIYIFLAISTPLAAWSVQRFQPKKIMIFSSIFYFAYCLSLLVPSTSLLMITSILLGISAAHLWTAQQSYLIRSGNDTNHGQNAGHFTSLYLFGPLLGVMIIGFLIEATSFVASFAAYAFFPLLGFSILFFLNDLPTIEKERVEKKTRNKKQKASFFLQKRFWNKNVFSLIFYWFTIASFFGISISIIPIEAKYYFSVSQISILLSMLYLIPILTSYRLGKMSDKLGREKMITISYGIMLLSIILLLFTKFSIFFFVLGVITMCCSRAITAPINTALLGDISKSNNLEYLSALSLSSQQLGVVLGLFSSALPSTPETYTILFTIIILSFALMNPLLKQKVSSLREILG